MWPTILKNHAIVTYGSAPRRQYSRRPGALEVAGALRPAAGHARGRLGGTLLVLGLLPHDSVVAPGGFGGVSAASGVRGSACGVVIAFVIFRSFLGMAVPVDSREP